MLAGLKLLYNVVNLASSVAGLYNAWENHQAKKKQKEEGPHGQPHDKGTITLKVDKVTKGKPLDHRDLDEEE